MARGSFQHPSRFLSLLPIGTKPGILLTKKRPFPHSGRCSTTHVLGASHGDLPNVVFAPARQLLTVQFSASSSPMRQRFSTSVRNQHLHPSLQYGSGVYFEHTHQKWISETGNLYTMFNFVGFARGLMLHEKVNIIVPARGASARLHGPVFYFHNSHRCD